jgi:hypothetical protein
LLHWLQLIAFFKSQQSILLPIIGNSFNWQYNVLGVCSAVQVM